MCDLRNNKNRINHLPQHWFTPPTQDEEHVPQDIGINQGGAHEEKDKEEEVP
jgi:hypothetical protein